MGWNGRACRLLAEVYIYVFDELSRCSSAACVAIHIP